MLLNLRADNPLEGDHTSSRAVHGNTEISSEFREVEVSPVTPTLMRKKGTTLDVISVSPRYVSRHSLPINFFV